MPYTRWLADLPHAARGGAARCVHARRPLAAMCIAGAARTFSAPLVLAALRYNLIEALGCDVRLFVQLKTSDTAKIAGVQRITFAAHRVEATTLAETLEIPWLVRLLEEVSVVDGAGSFAGAGRLVPQGLVDTSPSPSSLIVPGNTTAWRAHRATRCVLSPYLAAGTNEERLLLNHLGQAWCRGAIQRAEMHAGRRFDIVGFVRPDLVWWRPVPPWCAWNASKTLVSCSRSGCDLGWLAPRQYMGALLGQADLHRDCTDGASCCATPEALLQYAKRVGRCRERVRRGTVSRSTFHVCRANVAAAPPELDIFDAQPPVASLLRSSAACDESLGGSESGERDEGSALAAQRRGVPIGTAVRLNELFGADRSACIAALQG